jgi:hypothetical protein
MTDTKISNSTPIDFEVPSKPQPAPAAQPAPGPAESSPSTASTAPPLRRSPGPTFQSTLRSTPAPPLDRHQRKCSICRRQDRDEIDQAFLHWKPISSIEIEFHVSERAIYRHAHATGLYARRKCNLRFILENVLERHAEARITVDSLLRAIRAYVSISDTGEYLERPAHVVVSSGGLFQGTSPGSSPAPSAAQPARSLTIRPPRRANPRRKRASARRSRGAKAAKRQRQSIRNRPNSLKTKHRSRF